MNVLFVTVAVLIVAHSWIFVEALRELWRAFQISQPFYTGWPILVLLHSAVLLYILCLFVWHGLDVRRTLKERTKG